LKPGSASIIFIQPGENALFTVPLQMIFSGFGQIMMAQSAEDFPHWCAIPNFFLLKKASY
jgi:hypothetical protein